MWEGGTRTPALVHWPLALAPGPSSRLVHVTDWHPTILALAGLSSQEVQCSQDTRHDMDSPHQTHLDGVNQWPQLQDPALPPARVEMVYNIQYRNWTYQVALL